MSINEWYEEALRRRKAVDDRIEDVIQSAQRKFSLKCEIDAALDAGDEETFYALTNELRGLCGE